VRRDVQQILDQLKILFLRFNRRRQSPREQKTQAAG